jgi:hypothetical protein
MTSTENTGKLYDLMPEESGNATPSDPFATDPYVHSVAVLIRERFAIGR